jgi:hypothetical protein
MTSNGDSDANSNPDSNSHAHADGNSAPDSKLAPITFRNNFNFRKTLTAACWKSVLMTG